MIWQPGYVSESIAFPKTRWNYQGSLEIHAVSSTCQLVACLLFVGGYQLVEQLASIYQTLYLLLWQL